MGIILYKRRIFDTKCTHSKVVSEVEIDEIKKKFRGRGNVSSNAELLWIWSYRSVSTIGGYR